MSEQLADADRVLIPQEAAELLGVSVKDLLVAAHQGIVPGVRLAGEWRFSRSKLLRKTAMQAA